MSSADIAIIALAIATELVLLFAVATFWLGLRLRRPRQGPSAREHLTHALETADADLSKAGHETRRRALAAELAAIDAATPEERQAALAEYDDLTVAAAPDADADDERERLRRLLTREETRVNSLLALRDELQRLRMGYDRIRHMAAKLLADAAEGQPAGEDETAAYRKAEGDWVQALEALEQHFADTAEEETADRTPSDPEAGAQAQARELEQALAMKDKQIEELQARLDETGRGP